MSQQVLSANRLNDGLVVYLVADDTWSEDIEVSEVAGDEGSANALLTRATQAASDQKIVDPYLIEVAVVGGEIRPTKYREFIRATGPSVRADLSKQNYVPGADA